MNSFNNATLERKTDGTCIPANSANLGFPCFSQLGKKTQVYLASTDVLLKQ